MTSPARMEEPDGVELMDALLRHGLDLARAARNRRRGDVARLLDPANVPGGRLDLLALACAGMVDTRQPLGELVAWSLLPTTHRSRRTPTGEPPGPAPAPREHGTPRGFRQHHHRGDLPACPDCRAAHAVAQRPAICQQEFTRLTTAGVSPTIAADLTTLARLLARRVRPDLEDTA